MKLPQLQNTLFQDLEKAQSQRKKRSDWIEFEQNSMLDAVNRERALLGKQPVSLADVQRVEASAVGHVDYSRKFALYCAELVLDMRHRP